MESYFSQPFAHSSRIAIGHEPGNAEDISAVPVSERRAMFGYYYAPSRSYHSVTCRNVPFVGWGESRVEIDIAFGDIAELQR